MTRELTRSDWSWIAATEDLGHASAAGLRRALADAEFYEGSTQLALSPLPQGQIDDDAPIVEGLSFNLDPDSARHLRMTIDYAAEVYLEDEDLHQFSLSLLGHLLAPRGAALIRTERDQSASGPPWLTVAEVRVPTRGRDVHALAGLGLDAQALLDAASGQPITRESALALLRAGRPQALVGLPEGPWLDAKSHEYDLGQTSGKIKLARAVGRFANAEFGGLVVVGLSTRRVPGGEQISNVAPIGVDGRQLRRYQQAIEAHLYPPPDLLEIELVQVPGGQLVVLHVPPQPEELKPFLVHGAVVEGNVEGAFISIDRRRGQDSIPVTAPMIHSWLSAGRGLMMSGHLQPRERRSPGQVG